VCVYIYIYIYIYTRDNTNGELLTAAICYNDSAFATAVSPSVVIATPTVVFRNTVAAFLGFQGESSLCRVRCQIPLHRANRLVRD
jgi:hypothetical protein